MDIYDTNVLLKVVESLMRPQTFFLDRFFPDEQRSDSEFISFDVDQGKRRISPFVSPLVQGKIVRSRGTRTDTFRPAYIKDKRALDPTKPLKRRVGERIGGTMSAGDREQANLMVEMQDQLDMLTRRQELMAIDALLDGKIVVTGEGYDTVEVDFGRDADLTEALTTGGGTAWGETGVKPLDDLEDWATTMLQVSGAPVTDVVMDPKAWKLFRTDADVKELLDIRRGSDATAELGPEVRTGAVQKAMIGKWRIWVYQDWYVDDADTEQPMLPDYTVIMGSPAIEGARHFGAIMDPEAGYQAVPFWPKSWVEKDPALRMLMMQSAPLPVPYRVNASFTATIHD